MYQEENDYQYNYDNNSPYNNPSKYKMPYDEYRNNNYYPTEGYNQGYNNYTSKNEVSTYDTIYAEIILQVILLSSAFILPYLFFLIKKILKRLHWLNPRVLRVLDRIQNIMHNTIRVFSRVKIKKRTGINVNERETTKIISEELTDGLNEKLKVKPDEQNKELGKNEDNYEFEYRLDKKDK